MANKRESDDFDIEEEPESTYVPLKERKRRLVSI
jgi:hypothetical protein